MKRTVATILLGVLLLSILPIGASAATGRDKHVTAPSADLTRPVTLPVGAAIGADWYAQKTGNVNIVAAISDDSSDDGSDGGFIIFLTDNDQALWKFSTLGTEQTALRPYISWATPTSQTFLELGLTAYLTTDKSVTYKELYTGSSKVAEKLKGSYMFTRDTGAGILNLAAVQGVTGVLNFLGGFKPAEASSCAPIEGNEDSILAMLHLAYDGKTIDVFQAATIYFWMKSLELEDEALLAQAAAAYQAEFGIDSEESKAQALGNAFAALGNYSECTSFFDQAVWSARYYTIKTREGETSPDMSSYKSRQEVCDGQVDSANVANCYASDMEKAYAISLYYMVENAPPDINVWDPATKVETGFLSDMPIDALTCNNALKSYMADSAAGKMDTVEGNLEAYKNKLIATMGLASGMLAPTLADSTETGVSPDEVKEFLEAAYVINTSDIQSLMVGDVGQPVSAHMGVDVELRYYYYLVLAYQEFAAYAASLIDALGPAITADNMSYTHYATELKMLKNMFDAVTWADDTSLWAYWDADNTRLTQPDNDFRSLKSLYDYLMSVNAFEGIQDYDAESLESAFAYFFSTDEGFQLSAQMQMGVTASSTFLPMRSNTYDPYAFDGVTTTDWLVNFHAKFGYNRKALYRDTTVDAAVNYQRTKSRGTLSVCTLEDFLAPDQDIVLYIDDNLYNVEKLAEMTDKAFNRLDNVDSASSSSSTLGKLWESAKGSWEINMENVAKTAEVSTYSREVQSGGIISTIFTSWDEFFMPLDKAKEELSPDTAWDEQSQSMASTSGYTYGPMMHYAVLSGIYQDTSLFNSLNTTLTSSNPVFVSSPTVPYLAEASAQERNCIFNYMLLKNLDAQMTVDYATNLDLTSPIYMDVYGNIVTESGIVVVPAAANATLYRSTYRPYNAAFYSTYGDAFLLPYDEDAETLNALLETILTPVDGVWQLASLKVAGGPVDLSRLSTADKESLAEITDVFAYDVGSSNFCSDKLWKVIITEVLRGAPIESINKEFEGLNTVSRITKSGLLVANKLDELVEALSSEGTNATLSIPNPAYIDGLEYIVFFAFKILILITLVIWMATIYVDAVGGGIGLKTGGKCIGAVLLTITLIVGVPAIFELSYYESNKALLQDETELLMMLNLEKSESGNEIGITKVSEPEANTHLYLRLANVEIPWYDLLPKILTSSMDKNLSKMYEEYENAHPITGSSDVDVMNGNVFISTDKLFESSTVTFNSVSKTLYQQSAGDTPASYYTPYYVFLNQIIAKANAYAAENDYYAYSTKIQKGGRLKTLGYIQPYFTSEEFMAEGMDYFGLYTIYNATAPAQYDELQYSEETLTAIRDSQWCNLELEEGARIKRIEKLNALTQAWVSDHREMIGKVTDETFLKTMALACAMEHNRLFNTQRADYLEIQELGNEDLLRLSIADKDAIMRNSTMSFARFVYTVGGTPAVYAAAILVLVNFVSSWIKPLVTLIVFIITCISIFVFKLILRRDNKSVYGYITTILLMCVVNVVGAVFLKLTTYIPATGLSPTVCILIEIIAQLLYIVLLLKIVKVALKDWRNVGFQKYNAKFNTLIHKKDHSVDVATPPAANGWEYYNRLVDRQRRRHRSL